MSLSVTTTRQITISGGAAYSFSATTTDGTEVIVSQLVAAGANSDIVGFTVDQSQMKAFLLATDQDCTIVAKLDAATVDTFAMKANQAIMWEYAGGGKAALTACPLSGDINKLSVTNTPELTVTMVALIDPIV